MPVHSESRQPRTSSSSANPSKSSFTCLLQPALDRIAVDAPVLQLELVGPLVDGVDRVARHEPERDRLAAPAVLLARPRLGELRIGSVDRAGMLERLALPLLPEDLPDHSATRRMSRTQRSCSRKRRRNASRSSVRGPCPVTTCFNSSQSGSLYSQTPSSFFLSFGSGTVRPSSQICGT